MNNKPSTNRNFVFKNDTINISQDFNKDLDLKSIAEWIACGFFLGDKNFTMQKYGEKEKYTFESKWYYEPKSISFDDAVEEFAFLFEKIIHDYTCEKNIILPLSGGLDSRTIAVALRNKENVTTYSYEFENGIAETKYAKKISKVMGWSFHEFIIPEGYLWEKIEEIAKINSCQSDFVNPRQMAVIHKVAQFGDCIISGQWGDVLFDIPKIRESADIEEQAKYTFKKIVKPGGLELSKKLWEEWGYPGQFENILLERIHELLFQIKIDNPSRRILAFKSLHWAQRWANPNLKIFSAQSELIVPYYDDRICDFICKIPNEFLKNRKIQIQYIKSMAPNLAKIPWQVYDLNLYKFKYFNNLYFLRRVYRFLFRKIKENLFTSSIVVQRNWEIQFLGDENIKHLEDWILKNNKLKNIVSEKLTKKFYNRFLNQNQNFYSHPISMLLTLSVWCNKFWKKK